VERIVSFGEMEHGFSVACSMEPPPIRRLFDPGFAGRAAASDALAGEIALADMDGA